VASSSPPRRRQQQKRAAVVGSAILVIVVAALLGSDRRQFMKRTLFRRQNENTIEGRVTIKRPVEKEFEFYQNFKNLPSFLGEVMEVDETGPATSRWTIEGPLGIQAHWTIRVTEKRPNEFIRYETVPSPGLRTSWEVYFARGSAAGETEVREVMKAPLG